jgi:hypothetical protein
MGEKQRALHTAIHAEIARGRATKGSDLPSDEVLLAFSNLVFNMLSCARLRGGKSDIRTSLGLVGFKEEAETLIDGTLASGQ